MSTKQTSEKPALAETRKWNDPTWYIGVKCGPCDNCGKRRHVTRHGLCWSCENKEAAK